MKCVNKVTEVDFNIPFRTELIKLEGLNPCEQKYIFNHSACFIEYRQKMDVFNFITGLSLKLKFTIIGLPFSVSQKGYFGDTVQELFESTKGLKIILNGDDGLDLPKALTLSSYMFENRFESFDHYLESMRSHYRYRMKKALKKGLAIEVNAIERSIFNENHYRLYKDVFNNSKDQLECLSIDFFKEFPADIHEMVLDGKIVGFYQTIEKDGGLYFLFGGFDRAYLKTHDVYLNLLLSIVRLGIGRGVDFIEFGQTAEDSKEKIGCIPVRKYLYVYHHNPLILKILKGILPVLSYKERALGLKVFRDEYENHIKEG